MPASKLPLPLDFTPPSADTSAQWRRRAAISKEELVGLARLRGGRVRWTKQAEKQRVQIFRGVDDAAPPGAHTWCGVMEIQATIEEIDHLFRSDSPGGFMDACRLFDRDVLDSTTVCTLDDSPESTMGVQWLLTRTPGAFSRPRDWCLLTYNVTTKVQGRRGWVRAFTSVDSESCPVDRSRGGIVRGHHLRSGYVVMESTTRPGFLHLRLAVQCTMGGSMSDATIAKTLVAKCEHLCHIDQRLREIRLGAGPVLQVGDSAAANVAQCARCPKVFGLFTSKAWCQKCGLVCCRSCCPPWQIHLNGISTSLRACLDCSLVNMGKPSRLSFDEMGCGGSRRTEMDPIFDDEEPIIDPAAAAIAHEEFFHDMKLRASVIIQTSDVTRVSKADASSLWPQPKPRRRASLFYTDMGLRGSMMTDDSGWQYSSRSLLIQEDDLAKQIWQNRQSVLQII
ncbi:Aste57867_14605 [Aphanomyces stellatus]|uniref:Aste57867_14605 protein n=1 Tax=Aphanomyces stellatus TaxID=120398 RepID=A0A485L244_9STRA|nr:hypothetical protein As57867_014551 [Aphanomyces stellatus]VFT91424.1 Aste57867_14605 [Aphanomyces stellatus]